MFKIKFNHIGKDVPGINTHPHPHTNIKYAERCTCFLIPKQPGQHCQLPWWFIKQRLTASWWLIQ